MEIVNLVAKRPNIYEFSGSQKIIQMNSFMYFAPEQRNEKVIPSKNHKKEFFRIFQRPRHVFNSMIYRCCLFYVCHHFSSLFVFLLLLSHSFMSVLTIYIKIIKMRNCKSVLRSQKMGKMEEANNFHST